MAKKIFSIFSSKKIVVFLIWEWTNKHKKPSPLSEKTEKITVRETVLVVMPGNKIPCFQPSTLRSLPKLYIACSYICHIKGGDSHINLMTNIKVNFNDFHHQSLQFQFHISPPILIISKSITTYLSYKTINWCDPYIQTTRSSTPWKCHCPHQHVL